jgi:Iap family predicted aminopeptidase
MPMTAQAKPSFNQAIDRLFAQNYPQGIDAHIAALGTSPIGMRWAGTTADTAGAAYIADQLRAAGLKNVHLEPIPVDVFTFKGASVDVGSRHIVASSFCGVRPTPPGGLTGQVVYVHDGTAADYAGLDVKGKLVLADTAFDFWYMNLIQAEATAHGAVGVIMTYGPDSGSYYAVAPDALGSYDSESDLRYVPLIYIAAQDGDWLKAQLQSTSVTATMQLKESVRMATAGGVGYDVFGDLPGKNDDGTFVLFGAHHDAHFHSATDDTISDALNLTIAKAMKLSSYKPAHTVRFMFTTGEEFGYANSWWDWAVGSWYAITHSHTDWAGRVRAFMNNDYFCRHGAGARLPRRGRCLALWLRTAQDQHRQGQLDLHCRGRAERHLPGHQWRRRLRRLPHPVHDRREGRVALPRADRQARVRRGR